MVQVNPSATGADSIGSSSIKWGDVYSVDGDFSGTLTVDTLVVTGTQTQSEIFATVDPILDLATSNSGASAPYIGLRGERGSSDAYWLFDESTDSWTSYVGADTSSLAVANMTAAVMIATSFQHGSLALTSDASDSKVKLNNVSEFDSTTAAAITALASGIDTADSLTSIGSSSEAITVNSTSVDVNSIKVGDSVPFSDASGTLTLQNVDALDSTTEATIEAAIDTLANLTSVGASGSNLTVASDGIIVSTIQVGASTPFSDSTGTLTLQNVDALDATTEATIEAAVDTLANLTAVGKSGTNLTVSSDSLVVDDLTIGSSSPFTDSSGVLTLRNIDGLDATTTATLEAAINNLDSATSIGSVGTNLTVASDKLIVTDLQVGSSLPFSDNAGALTLQNVDALDATTETTLEAAIDSLPNLATAAGSVSTLALDATTNVVVSSGRLDLGTTTALTGVLDTFSLEGAMSAKLSKILSIDAATEATIEGSIDTLANLTASGNSGIDLTLLHATVDVSNKLDVGTNLYSPDFQIKDGSVSNVTVLSTPSQGNVTLSGITALDSATQATVEAAVTTLSGITSLGALSSNLALFGDDFAIKANGDLSLIAGASGTGSMTLTSTVINAGSGASSRLHMVAGSLTTGDTLNIGGVSSNTDLIHVDATNGVVGFGTSSPNANAIAQFNGDIYVSNGSAIKSAIDSNDFLLFDTDVSLRSSTGKLILRPEDQSTLNFRDEVGVDSFVFKAEASESYFKMKSRAAEPHFAASGTAGIGASGDEQGQMVHYNGDVYFCIADYDANDNLAVIWKKLSLASI